MQSEQRDKKINPLYPIVWCAFLLVPAYALYKGWQHHSMLAVIAASLAIAGFITLIIIAVRHNRRLARRPGQ